jgi:glycosyltransferase involved in cell wall biosynthesis
LTIASIEAIWNELQFADICLANDLQTDVGSFLDVSWEKANLRRSELEYMDSVALRQRPYFNSGVILWRRCAATDRLFQVWHEEWKRFHNLDQMALVRALAHTGTEAHTLSSAWNCPANRFPSIDSAQTAGVRILHFLSKQRNLLPQYVEEFSSPRSQVSLGSAPKQESRRGALGIGARMRVLWITGTLFPQIGGEQIFIEKTIGSLSDFCEVGLVTKLGQWYPGNKPIAHFAVGPRASSRTAAWQQIIEALDDIVLSFAPDIVHFGSAHSALCRVAIPEWMPTVATVHGNDLTGQQPSPAGEDPTPYIVDSLNACDSIFAVSSHTSSLVREWGVKTPVDVFTPGCDIDFFRPWPELGEQARIAWQIPADVPLILTVSRLAPRKGHLNVLEAIRRLPFRAHWVVVGEGSCGEELADAVRERRMQDQVSMLGGISDDDLLALYNACDVFVLTPEERRIRGWLDSEGFGLVLHEAGACGKPVIASALAGCRDAVIDGGTGILVPPSDPARLAQALELVLTSPALAKSLGAGGLSLVRISGGWSRLARQTFEKYEEILGQDFGTPELPDSLVILNG